MSIRQAALEIFTPPFRYENGFIVDSSDSIVAYSWRDKAARLIARLIASRIRGCGRIQYMDNPEFSADEIQDEVGKIVAEALNSFLENSPATNTEIVSADSEPKDTSETVGMNIAQRILHVGGRNNSAGYIEFGSVQAVEALVNQVILDNAKLENATMKLFWPNF